MKLSASEMTDTEVFVKRVEFEENNNNPSSNITIRSGGAQSDVEKLTEPKQNEGCTTKMCYIIDKLGAKSALSHIGLLLSLFLFCYFGGWVKKTSDFTKIRKKTNLNLSRCDAIYNKILCFTDHDLCK